MASTAQSNDPLHVFFFPFMSPGHLSPMIDIARLFASHGTKATILATPQKITRFQTILNRDQHTTNNNNIIDLLVLDFPYSEANLPENYENLDTLPSRNFSCASQYKPHATVSSDTELFLVPGLPHPVYITMSQMPVRFFGNLGLHEFFEKFMEAERDMYGVVSNTFCEIEPEYVKHYEKLVGKKVWPVGLVSLFNTKALDIAERGNRASIDKDQLLEIGLGLESSKASFTWVIRDSYGDGFLLEDFEERVRYRAFVIKGWAPQVLILNHSAVGGFMTHCGWNSVLESVTAGVPLITWPLFAEQFYNENFVLNRLGIRSGIGVKTGLAWGEEENIGVLVDRDHVEEVVTRLMGESEAVQGMRNRVSKLSKLAMAAISKGGSSYVNMVLLIEDLLNLRRDRLSKSE
ncbi:UDP-glycosyltransferase 73C3 [Quercus suber]|uniref:UDP-glycosyltransferase 73C3 n=1 Tax=Quercus suber TaxID=58331 RepID=UPI0032DF87C2